MLALDRPLGTVSGLVLYGDHADPERIYYASTRPRLALAADGRSEEFVLLKFRPEDASEDGVGLLSFTTDLRVDERQLEQAAEWLNEQGIPRPRLSAIPWTAARAVLATALQEGDGFVEQLLAEVPADPLSANRAMFSARLRDAGARLLEAMTESDGPVPLGVRYELEYQGLRPALNVRIEADYQRIYDELSFAFRFGVAYQGVGVRAAVDVATQKLTESGAIRIQVEHFTDDADLKQRVDTALQWLQQKILDDFFQDSLQPPVHQNLLERALEGAVALGAASLQEALSDDSLLSQLAQQLGVPPQMLSALGGLGGAASGGSGGMPGGMPGGMAGGGGGAQAGGSQSSFALNLQFTFRDIRQEQLKTLVFDWREAHAETRKAAPQGLLSDLADATRVIEADEANEFWERLQVNVRPLGDFPELGVSRMLVQWAHPTAEMEAAGDTLVFEAGAPEPQRFAAWTEGRPPTYEYRTEVHFSADGLWPGDPVFRGQWQPGDSRELALHPLSGVPRVAIDIEPGTLDFQDVSQVRVDLRVADGGSDSVMLTADTPRAIFRWRPATDVHAGAGGQSPTVVETPTPGDGMDEVLGGGLAGGPVGGGDLPMVAARYTWFLNDGGSVEGQWQAVEGSDLLVPAPWRGRRQLRLFPVLPDDFLEAIVTVTVTEEGHSRSEDVVFTPEQRRAVTVSLPTLAATPPPARVDVLVIRGDSTVFQGQPFETGDPVVVIRDRDGDSRQILVRLLAAESLAVHGLLAVQCELLAPSAGGSGDGADEWQVVDTLNFTEMQREPQQMIVPIGDAEQAAAVHYRVVRYGVDGRAQPGPVQTAAGNEILIPAVTGG